MSNLLNAVLNYGGAVSLFIVVIATFIEITPIKINPIQWLGKRFNKDILDEVKRIDTKVDQHVAEDYRYIIMNFQNESVNKQLHTKEQFALAINTCKRYENYVKENNIENGEADEAIKYIRRCYAKRLDKNDFLELPQ